MSLTLPTSTTAQRLLDLFASLAAPHPLGDVLTTILDATTDVLGCERASLLLYDTAADRLRFVAATHEEAEALAQIPVPLDGSLAGTIFRDRRPLIAADPASDTRHFQAPAEATGYRPRAIAGVPLVAGGETIGVLEALDPHGDTFDDDDLRLLEAVAAQAAVAIRAARERFDAERMRARLAERDRLHRGVLHALARTAAAEKRRDEAAMLALACSHLDASTLRTTLGWADVVGAALPDGAPPVLDLCDGLLSVAADQHRLADVLDLCMAAALGGAAPDVLDVCVAEHDGLAQVEVRGPGVDTPEAEARLAIAALLAERDTANITVADGAIVVSLPRASEAPDGG